MPAHPRPRLGTGAIAVSATNVLIRRPESWRFEKLPMDIAISLITTLVLTLINGYFSMSEMALTTAKRAVLEHEAEEGDKRAERAIKLAADSDQLLATIQVAITLVGFASSAVASTSLSDPLATWLMSFGIAPLSAIARGLAPVIITVAVAFVSIVIGELVPSALVWPMPKAYPSRSWGRSPCSKRSPVRSCG